MFKWFRYDLSFRSLFGYGEMFPTKEDIEESTYNQIMAARKDIAEDDTL
jgi:hypothetical protein